MSLNKLTIIFLVTLGIFLGTLYAIIYNDIGGTQKYAREIPWVNSILPKNEKIEIVEEELNSYSHTKLLKYALDIYAQNKKLDERNKKLEKEALNWSTSDGEILRDKYNEQKDKILELEAETKRLEEFENEYIELKRAYNKLEYDLAMQNKTEFTKYYESIEPDKAEEIYMAIFKEKQLDEDFQKYIGSFVNIEPEKAADVIEELMRTDYDLVIKIMRNLETEVVSSIINNIDVSYATMITKSLAG